LQELPIDVIKIDRSFITNMEQNPRSATLAQTVTQLGKSLGLITIAEGIETAEQLRRLQALGCNCGQGFFFAAPMPADEVVTYLYHNGEVEMRPEEVYAASGVIEQTLDLDPACV
jgi:EAL domain-containing protein (putative c-di-GMP-specific phosphodiesterase class I)